MADTTVKFGLGQVSNPTPQGFKIAFRIWTFLAAAAAIIMAGISGIPEPIKLKVLEISSVGTLIFHQGIKLFGLSDVDTPNGQG